MIENYVDKKARKKVRLEVAESGNVAIVEQKFDEDTGKPIMMPTQETNTAHLKDLIADNEERLAPFLQRRADLEALLEDVQAKEGEHSGKE